MRAIIRLDVPDWQIGTTATVYFPDTMRKWGVCEAENGWISVKDRLPESSGIKVFVTAKTIPESALQTKAVFVAFQGYGDGKWYTPDVDFMASATTGNDNVHPVWEITHWIPLPEPQKEDV